MKTFRKFSAFTLAEVLIILGIIGIVAALTIPALMNSTSDAELRMAWKKSYSIISQATMEVLNDNQGSLAGVFTSADQMKEIYKPHILKSKDCDASQNCVYNFTYMNGISETNPNETSIFLNDGSIWEFGFTSTNCDALDGTSLIPDCGGITVDVNGKRPPDVVGRDIFIAMVQKDRVIPGGAQGQGGNYSGCNKTVFGWGCSALYLAQ